MNAILKGLICLGVLAAPVMATAQTVLTVPSGQPISRLDILLESREGGAENWLVLRFLTPDIARKLGKISYGDVEEDLKYLCETMGLRVAGDMGQVDQIVVTLLDQPLNRGTKDQNVTQFMSAYRLVDGRCEWE